MSFYDSKENVFEYVQMCASYNGENLYSALAENLPEQSRLLELGSGPGIDIEQLKKRYQVTGSDLSEVFLGVCREKHPSIPFLSIDVKSIAKNLKGQSQFDCIYSNKVLHHLTEQELVLSLIQQKSLLTGNGLIAHSFWLGKGSEEKYGLLFNYYQQDELIALIGKYFEVVSELLYQEFDTNDSLFIIARI